MKSEIKYRIKRGDTVTVIAGDEKGKSGRVLQVLPQTGRVLIEGVNLAKKHMRKSESYPQGGVIDIETSIAISNVKVTK